jgi:hypothetical protein
MLKSHKLRSVHGFWGAFGKVRGIKRDFHAQNDVLWQCRRLSFKFKTRSTSLSIDSLSRRQIGHRSNRGGEEEGGGKGREAEGREKTTKHSPPNTVYRAQSLPTHFRTHASSTSSHGASSLRNLYVFFLLVSFLRNNHNSNRATQSFAQKIRIKNTYPSTPKRCPPQHHGHEMRVDVERLVVQREDGARGG